MISTVLYSLDDLLCVFCCCGLSFRGVIVVDYLFLSFPLFYDFMASMDTIL